MFSPDQLMLVLLANPFLLFILIAWTLTLKGVSLWMSARREQKNWFIALLVLNTLGILEIVYIAYTKYKERDETEETDSSDDEETEDNDSTN